MAVKTFSDLREFISSVEELGECRHIDGADWDLEMGNIRELALSKPNPPLILFDEVKGYKPGYRVLTNLFDSPRRLAFAMGLPLDIKDKLGLVRAWRDKCKGGFIGIPPVEVKTGPVKENVHVGNEVDLFEFPVPKWHTHDGGRYIGTAHMVIMRDPDDGWVNFGTYRVQAQDKNTATLHVTAEHHGFVIARKYWERGLSCPVAVVCGEDPMLWSASITDIPRGVSEYDYTGWVRGKPVEVVRGETVDLPIPATAEIVLEGEFTSPEGETRIEGPFGEWEGYYAGGARPHPVIKVKAILHRDNPILMGSPPAVAQYDMQDGVGIIKSARLWDELDRQVQGGVKGVWCPEEGRVRLILVVSVRQQYPGHAKQVGLVTMATYWGGSSMTNFVIVVDDDIDPSNMSEVLWAMATRCDPETAIDIIGGRVGIHSDPRLPPDKRERGDTTVSTAIIYACKPYSWINKFPRSIKPSPEILKKTEDKWGKALL